METKKATRVGIRPLIGLYGESGSGKTMSALLLARGFVGKDGIIGLVDSESGRGSLYADVIPGGYETLGLTAPFASARYIEALNAVEKTAKIGILDSGSHEWEGIGGVLDMAGDEEQRGMKGLGVWRKPKMEHAKFMLSLLQSPIPWIICLRAKHKSRQIKNAQGKTEIVKDDNTSPIQADDFLFEMTVHLEIITCNHHARMTKCSHPALRACFPASGPIEIKHGELLRQWCEAPTTGTVKPEPAEPKKGPKASNILKKQLWSITRKIHLVPENKDGDMLAVGAGAKMLEQWLWDEDFINSDGETLAGLTTERLAEIISKLETKGAQKNAV